MLNAESEIRVVYPIVCYERRSPKVQEKGRLRFIILIIPVSGSFNPHSGWRLAGCLLTRIVPYTGSTRVLYSEIPKKLRIKTTCIALGQNLHPFWGRWAISVAWQNLRPNLASVRLISRPSQHVDQRTSIVNEVPTTPYGLFYFFWSCWHELCVGPLRCPSIRRNTGQTEPQRALKKSQSES